MSLLEETRKNLDAFLATSDEELERITRETSERDAMEPRAKTVHYDEPGERVVVELKNGVVLMVPTRLVQGLNGADPELLSRVEKDGRGYGLNWEELGVTVSVPGLLNGIFGNSGWMEQLRQEQLAAAGVAPTAAAMGRKGGSATTTAKRAASRANGKLGGRPRKKATA